MFQRLDQLKTGSLFILTGAPGAGKSHLAASARKSGSIWILDTEGASQNLTGKDGIHGDIRALQTLSLRQLLDAMQEIRRAGKPGDLVVLDSISKVLQAMRAHAQQRAGADTGKKTAISYDEHASVNRNLQVIYTGLTELKHAGFNIIIIGHLAKKYQTSGSALSNVGVRVLADENIVYEADAVILVERSGAKRTIKAIDKPPRVKHLQLDQVYPATIEKLYPDQAVAAQRFIAPVGDDDVLEPRRDGRPMHWPPDDDDVPLDFETKRPGSPVTPARHETTQARARQPLTASSRNGR